MFIDAHVMRRDGPECTCTPMCSGNVVEARLSGSQYARNIIVLCCAMERALEFDAILTDGLSRVVKFH